MAVGAEYSVFGLPNELLSLISCHLNIVEYFNLRISSVHASIPKIASVTWESYIHSVLRIRNSKWKFVKRIQYSDYLEPQFEFMDDYRLGLIIENTQTIDLRKLKKLNYLTPSVKQLLFDHSIRRNDFDLFFEFVMDPQINKTDRDNLVIEMATNTGNVEMCRLILADPDVNPTNAIDVIRPDTNIECIHLLVKDPRTDLDRAMAVLIENGFSDSACELLHTNRAYFANEDTILWHSVRNNDSNILKLWMQYNPDYDSQNMVIHVINSILYEHMDCLNLILEDERVLLNHSEEILRWAVKRGDIKSVKLFLPLSHCTSKFYNEMLYYSCLKGKIDIISLLFNDGRINIADTKTFRPLHASIIGNHMNCLEYLLTERCIPVDKRTIGLTCKSGKVAYLKLLLSSNNVNPSPGIGPAATNGHFDCLQLLLNDERTFVRVSELKSIVRKVDSLKFPDCYNLLNKYIIEQTANENNKI
ncbi:hypothetical protein BC833DRAFT_625975 [Globomyces pollinis-pini]|nr:hypothetical protein BC833DRAFT_625975 [Globomyces pollinis-pini]